MGLLSSLFGGPAVSAVEGVANVIDKFVETDEEKKAAELLKAKLAMKPSLAQVELNKIEASHRSIFVAGARPFILWICGVGLTWHFILHDLMTWICAIWLPQLTPPALSGTEELITVLLALLGLGGMRTIEKIKRVTK